jgi:hypothetical protein
VRVEGVGYVEVLGDAASEEGFAWVWGIPAGCWGASRDGYVGAAVVVVLAAYSLVPYGCGI